MSRRWSTFLGRAGTILIAAGVALVLLSIIPPRTDQNTDFGETSILQPKTFSIESPFLLSITFDPQRGFYMSVQANQSVTVYLLSVSKEYVVQWIENHFSENSSSTANTSVLEDFLSSSTKNSVAWQENAVDGKVEFQFAPARLMNVTLIFSNPSTGVAKVKYNGKLLNFIVPSERALTPAKFIMPIGVAFTLIDLTVSWSENYKRNWKKSGFSHNCLKSDADPENIR